MDNEKCSLTDSVQVNLVEATEISISRDTILCPTDFPYLIEADAPFATQVRWENGNENQERLITRAGDYTFFAESGGCTTSATVTVLENDCQVKVYIPTAFSPNNDGINDFWEVYGVNFKITEITIFDRWGNIVHTNQNNTIPWNGKTNDNDMPTGVYVYIITYKNLLTTETGVRKGDFTLIR
jgi:gliding motility-associated-like protein